MGRPTETSRGDNAVRHTPIVQPRPVRVALIGNPNTGKTTLFNQLTGYHRHVANYPGVTVEIGHGAIRGAARPMELIDLPGTYSLAAASPDEEIVTRALCGRGGGDITPDVVLAIVDASNPSRNLYLLSQVLELRIPLVVALNMVDAAEARGIRVDADALAGRLGVRVVPVVATRSSAAAPIVAALELALDEPLSDQRPELPEALVREAEQLRATACPAMSYSDAVRALLYEDGVAEAAYVRAGACAALLAEARQRLKTAGIDGPLSEVQARYAWVNKTLDGIVTRPLRPVVTWSDRVDRILTHRLGGALVLLAVLYGLFWALFTGAQPLMAGVETLIGWLAALIERALPEGVLQSLIVDGVISGVGGVLIFLPQILILFAFIAILEDCGYLARAAYMVDRLMRGVGLSGRAFIPLLSSFACAVPAIMGTRAIADRRERFLTIMLAPFMSCSARLPVYVILISAFVPATTYVGGWVRVQPLVMLAMYLVGIVVAIPVAWLLKRTLLAGPAAGFVMELPSYKMPRPRAVWHRTFFAGRDFVVRAGSVILVVNIVMWALAYFPRSQATLAAVQREAAAAGWDDHRFANELNGAYLRDSYLGHMGHAIEPVIAPLGWDWRIGVAVMASFPAREVIIATLGTLFNLGTEQDETSGSLRDAMRAATVDDGERPLFTLPIALSIMVFFALCAQCGATLATIRKETGSWMYPVLSFVGMTTIAYFAAWGTAALGTALGL